MEIRKFSQIDADYLKSDFHLHSCWTDGEGSISEIVETAKRKKLNRIAITDHIRIESTYFNEYFTEIKNIEKLSGITVLAGFEAKIKNFDGDLDVSDENLRKAELSIGSVHRFPLGRELFYAKEFTSEISQKIEFQLSLAAIEKGGFSVLGHPGGMSIRTHNEFNVAFFEEIIKECSKHKIAFDFNKSYHQKYRDVLITLFRKYDPLISLGSDAHRLKDIGEVPNW